MGLVVSLAKSTAAKLQLVEHGSDDELLVSPAAPLSPLALVTLCEYLFQ